MQELLETDVPDADEARKPSCGYTSRIHSRKKEFTVFNPGW
jgi:hypothetical protein